MHALLGTPLHHLIVALAVARNEDDLSAESLPCISQQLHGVRTATPLLAVPEDHALGLDVLMDETCDGGAECALLVGADPDEEPVGGLNAGGEGGADASTGADTDAAFEHCRGVADAGCNHVSNGDPSGVMQEHTELELSCPYSLWWIGDEVLGEVSLNTTDHVVMGSIAALADDTKSVVLHDGRTADSSQKTLLHAALELEDRDFW